MTCRAGFCFGGAAGATAAEVDDSSPATPFHFPSPAIARNRIVGFCAGLREPQAEGTHALGEGIATMGRTLFM